MTNPIIDTLLNRKSIRKYTDQVPSEETVLSVVRAGQQAPFAAQSCSLLLSRDRAKNRFHAPLQFTICADFHKLELIMAKRDWTMVTNDLMLLFYGMQDAMLMAENLVIAAEGLGMGSCFLGLDAKSIERIQSQYKLPKRVLPIVGLAMGYPAEDHPPRPRYPVDFFLFENAYPEFRDEQIEHAMAAMDEGYIAQDYYRSENRRIPLEGERAETFTYENYSWTEHMSRKWGQWYPCADDLLRAIANCGFRIDGESISSDEP